MEHFIHLPEFQVIICKKCKYRVLPSHIDAHFASKAHKLERSKRRRIADEVAEINGLIGNEETLARSEFPSPPPNQQTHSHIRVTRRDCITVHIANSR
jgi:hypothetical protein